MRVAGFPRCVAQVEGFFAPEAFLRAPDNGSVSELNEGVWPISTRTFILSGVANSRQPWGNADGYPRWRCCFQFLLLHMGNRCRREVCLLFRTKAVSFLVFYIAHRRGFYRDEGIEFEPIVMQPSLASTAALTGAVSALERRGYRCDRRGGGGLADESGAVYGRLVRLQYLMK